MFIRKENEETVQKNLKDTLEKERNILIEDFINSIYLNTDRLKKFSQERIDTIIQTGLQTKLNDNEMGGRIIQKTN